MFNDVVSYLLQCPQMIDHDIDQIPSSELIEEEFYALAKPVAPLV
jgi:hypothetical protein